MFYQKSILDNGITVISERMEAVRSVSLGIWFKVGSRDESDAEQGISHFLEHMMFKGTERRDALKISEDFESIGAEQNAFTSKEYTCYFARFVDDKLPQILDILGDMVTSSLFLQEAINSEREVVIEEIARSEDTPDDYVFDLLNRAMFPTHPLGRPIIGSREVVGSFLHEDCISYLDKHYHAGNCIVAACGHVDHAELVALCEKNLSGLTPKTRNSRDNVDMLSSERLALLKKDTEQAHIVYGMPGMPLGDKDRFAHSLLDTVLGGGMSSRLFQEIREKRGLAYAVYASNVAYSGAGQFVVYAGTRPSNIMELVSIIRNEIKRMLDFGLTAEELERAREYVIGHIVLSMESTSTRMVKLGTHSISDLELLSLDESIQRYREVTLEDTARVAERLLTFEPTIAIISPLDEQEITSTLKQIIPGLVK